MSGGSGLPTIEQLDRAIARLAALAGRERVPHGADLVNAVVTFVRAFTDEEVLGIYERSARDDVDAAGAEELFRLAELVAERSNDMARAAAQYHAVSDQLSRLLYQASPRGGQNLYRRATRARHRALRAEYAALVNELVPVRELASDAYAAIPGEFPTSQVPLCTTLRTPVVLSRCDSTPLATFSALRERITRSRFVAEYASGERGFPDFDDIYTLPRILARRVAAWTLAHQALPVPAARGGARHL